MPDIAVPYVLTTPAGVITFNDSTADDQFYVQEIGGLAGAPIRAPKDDVPFGHGAIVHNFWEGGRPITFDGVFLVTSAPWGDALIAARNDMEEDLRVALRSILDASSPGTLAWTPQGQAARLLYVMHDVQLECPHDQNYLVRTFHFGLFAADPDWDGWTS
jgi:hypothetical protein